jgi:hypothetical protein
MLRGQATVFLSCSEKFKERVALPIRQAPRDRGVFGVIVSEEPLLPRTSGDPDSKVESYLDASDAFVALCTPDDVLQDGTAKAGKTSSMNTSEPARSRIFASGSRFSRNRP